MVLFPIGGELVGPGEEVLLRWHYASQTDCPTVVELLVDGRPVQTIARVTSESYNTEHCHSWVVPRQMWTQRAQIRVSIFDGAWQAAVSRPFSVWDLFKVQVLSPAGGDVVQRGQKMIIAWHASGSPASSFQVRLLLDGDRPQVIARLPGTADRCSFTIPNNLRADRGRIEIVAQDAAGHEGYYPSEGPFSIVAGPVTVGMLPLDEGAVLRPGQEVNVRWQIEGGLPPYQQVVAFVVDNQVLDEANVPPVSRSSVTPVPNVRTDHGRLRVTVRDAGGGEAVTESDPLTVLGRALKVQVTSPGRGKFAVGQRLPVEWTVTGGMPPYSTSIFLRANGASERLASRLEENYFDWIVSNRAANDARMQVVVRDAAGTEVSNLSEGAFTIEGFTVRVAYPNGREFVKAEQQVEITWEATGPVSSFDVNLLIDGKVAEYIARDLPGTALSYKWLVPYMPTDNAYIQVIARDALGRPMAQDDSDGWFSISKERPLRVTVLHPDGSALGDQIFRLGDHVTITWKVEGRGVPSWFKVDLVEVGEEGRQVYPIAARVAGEERSCEWTIAGVPPSDTARILVEVIDEAGFHDLDDSDYYFKIQ